MSLAQDSVAGESLENAESCRVLGCGARLNGRKLACILGTEGVVAVALGVGVAAAGIHESAVCGGPWFGMTPGWGGIRIGGSGIAWALVVSTVALFLLGTLLFIGAATAWRPPLDPKNRRVALTASLIAGQPFIWVGMAIAAILVLPVVTANSTVGSASTGWHWFDEALLLVALVVGARVGWRACIAASTAPHRTQIISGIILLAFVVFLAVGAAGISRVGGGGLAPAVSPGSFLTHPTTICMR
jgi:hypothetical protein